MPNLVLIERPSEGVVHVVLNRPERRNALTGPMVDQLGEVLETLNLEEAVKVIVIRGAGKAFCSGLDLKEFAADPQPEWVRYFPAKWRRVHRALYESDRVLVGALERAAVNGGAALAMACDFLIVGDDSFLQVGEIQQGMAAPLNMSWLRLRHSEAVAARVALLGDRILGPELVRLGIAHQSVPDAQVLNETHKLADRLGEHDAIGIRRIKVSLRRTMVTETADQWFERALNADPFAGHNPTPIAAQDK